MKRGRATKKNSRSLRTTKGKSSGKTTSSTCYIQKELDVQTPDVHTSYEKQLEVIEKTLTSLQTNNYCEGVTTLYDSDVDGNGRTIINTVLNKQNLFFISFDEESNVFGGFIGNKIKEKNKVIESYYSGDKWDLEYYDEFYFLPAVFSLVRNGEIRTKVYRIKSHDESRRTAWEYDRFISRECRRGRMEVGEDCSEESDEETSYARFSKQYYYDGYDDKGEGAFCLGVWNSVCVFGLNRIGADFIIGPVGSESTTKQTVYQYNGDFDALSNNNGRQVNHITRILVFQKDPME